MKHIILMGFMGCGKSTIGNRLSEKLNKKLIDTDSLIEQKEDMTINQIFKSKGEAYFRDMEYAALQSLLDEPEASIISLGGGTPLREMNQPLLKELGTVVYLKATPNTIYERTRYSTNRPLLQCDNPRERIIELLNQRNPIYEKLSDVVVCVDDKKIDEIVNCIMEEVLYEDISD